MTSGELVKPIKAKNVFGAWKLSASLDSFAFEEVENINKQQQQLVNTFTPGHNTPVNSSLPTVLATISYTKDKSEQITIQALLDSGGSKSLIERRVAQRMGLTHSKSTPTRWTTPGGELVTDTTVKVPLVFPMLNQDTVINWSFHVTPDMGARMN